MARLCVYALWVLALSTLLVAVEPMARDGRVEARELRTLRRVLLGVRDDDKPITALPDTVSGDVEVLYLQSPLMKASFGSALGYANLFHGGVGFCVGKTAANCTRAFAVEYYAKNGVGPTLVPSSGNPSGTPLFNGTNLVWTNQAEWGFLDNVDMTYWTQKTVIATLKPADYQDLAKFIKEDAQNPAFQRYKLFQVVDSKSKTYSNSSTCVDFAWRVFRKLLGKGLCLQQASDNPPKRDYVQLVHDGTAKPQQLDMANPAQKQEFVQWFSKAAAVIAGIQDQITKMKAATPGQPLDIAAGAKALSGMLQPIIEVSQFFYTYVNDGKLLKVQLNKTDKLPVKVNYSAKALDGQKNPFKAACKKAAAAPANAAPTPAAATHTPATPAAK